MTTFGNPAESLLGMTLEGDWKVIEIVKRKPEETGGHFSVCYIVENEKKKAFLKALDLIDALQQSDFVDAIHDAKNGSREALPIDELRTVMRGAVGLE